MRNEIKRKKEEVIKKYGSWTAHNINLGNGIYTIDEKLNYDTMKLRRVLQIINDISGEKFDSLKVLDLGSFEGLYAIELGLQKTERVVGIEGRTANLKKAKFSKDTLGINNIEFFQDDVRNLSEQKYGRFDVILCLGLLYHLDTPDVFYLLEKIYKMCDRFLIIDTHIALSSDKKVDYRKIPYFGAYAKEFKKGLSKEKKEKLSWNALDNEKSFLFSKKSLLKFLHNTGFSSIFECHVPFEYIKPDDRVTFLAIKRDGIKLRTYPALDSIDEKNARQIMLKIRNKQYRPGFRLKMMLSRTKDFIKGIIYKRYRTR
jgi:hypothetical protein